MAATASSLLEGLTGAIALSNAALEDGADFAVRRAAMRSLHRALDRTAESDELWTDLTARAAEASSMPAPEPDLKSVDALLDVVADVFLERYAVLLAAGGYKSPPPPRVNELLAATRKAFLSESSSQPLDRVANARDGLRNFVQVVAANINSNNGGYARRVLQSGRKVAVASLLLPLIWSTEIKTGDEFDVNFGFSRKDGASIEITVKQPWAAADAAADRIVGAGLRQLELGVEESRTVMATMGNSFDDTRAAVDAADSAVDKARRYRVRTLESDREQGPAEWIPASETDTTARARDDGHSR
jgi:hypothetical protein